jgi:hypothetical protein
VRCLLFRLLGTGKVSVSFHISPSVGHRPLTPVAAKNVTAVFSVTRLSAASAAAAASIMGLGVASACNMYHGTVVFYCHCFNELLFC